MEDLPFMLHFNTIFHPPLFIWHHHISTICETFNLLLLNLVRRSNWPRDCNKWYISDINNIKPWHKTQYTSSPPPEINLGCPQIDVPEEDAQKTLCTKHVLTYQTTILLIYRNVFAFCCLWKPWDDWLCFHVISFVATLSHCKSRIRT